MSADVKETGDGNLLAHLCDTCRGIDFRSYFIKIENSPDSPQEPEDGPKENAKLGYLDEIIERSSTCEFCDLLVSCARRLNDGEDPPTSKEGDRVEVELDEQFLCTADQVDLDGQLVKKLDVSRLIINFEPAILENHFSSRQTPLLLHG